MAGGGLLSSTRKSEGMVDTCGDNSPGCTFVKTYQTACFKYVQFIVCQLSINEALF